MKKKKIIAVFVALLMFIMVVVSCSDADPNVIDEDIFDEGEDTREFDESVEQSEPIEAQAMLSELERNMVHYQILVQTEGTAENYLRLASLYNEAGMIRKQRDLLEQSYRIYHDEDAFLILQSIVVNLSEESALILDKVLRAVEFFNINAYHSNIVELVTSEDWFMSLMPNLGEGKRNYYFENTTDGSITFVEVGFDALNENAPYTRMWHYTPVNDDVVYLFQSGNMFKLIQTKMIDNTFDGEFSLWLCVVNGDTIYHETGTFRSGVIVGEFVSRVHSTSEHSDLISLFSFRDYFEYEVYLGNFNEYGETIITPPSGVSDSQIAYALSEDGGKFLFYAISDYEDRDGFIFDYSFLGLMRFPNFETYTPLPLATLHGDVTLDLSQVQIRVFDSVIQWFDGEMWHNAGSVMELLASDPFRSTMITVNNAIVFINIAFTSDSGGIASPWINRGGASAIQAQSATQTPQAPQTPPASGGQTPPASGGGGGGTTTPPQPPQPPPPPPPPPPFPPVGGDTDIDFNDLG